MEQKCPQCGAELPAGALAGLCPACLLKQANTEAAGTSSPFGFRPPSVEELAKLFPQLEILSLLGRGGMGAVYKARQPLLDRFVALKIIPPQLVRGQDFAERFAREARALAKLNHPNIVMVYDFGQVDGQPYFIMEYVDGLNLRQLEREGKLSPAEALQIVPQICEALEFAHDAGIVHRDIKPDNILIDKRGRVKIADFGIAKIMGVGADPAIPVTQGIVGTPHYMAPEQVERPQTVDHRADIFSLGVVFYEMLTGELPLGRFGPPSSSQRGVTVDVRLDEIVLRALEREPSRRYQRASHVKTAVETVAGTPGGPGAPPPGPQLAAPAIAALVARDYQFSIRSCIRRGWALLLADFWPLVGVTALVFALIFVVSSTSSHTTYTIYKSDHVTVEGISYLIIILSGPLIAGLNYYFVKKIRREPATMETAFAGFSKRFLHLALGSFVTSILCTLGFACFALPGIFLTVAWFFTSILILDRGLDFWPAMELSRKVVSRHWWKVLFFILAMGVVGLVGLLACGIGIFVAAPLMFAATMYAYEDIFGEIAPAPAAAVNHPSTIVIPPAAFAASAAPANPADPAAPAPGGPPPPVSAAPPAGGPPPPIGAVPPASGPPPPVPPRQSWFGWGKPIVIVGAVLGLILLMLCGAIALLPTFGFHVNDHLVEHKFGAANIHRGNVLPRTPEPPALPPRPTFPCQWAPSPQGPAPNPAYLALTDRVKKGLAKFLFDFDQLIVESASETNLVLGFSGLRQASSSGTNQADAGTLSINVGVGDSADGTNYSIAIHRLSGSPPDLHANPGAPAMGQLNGHRTSAGSWKFTGDGQLTNVDFVADNLDLHELAAQTVSASAHQTLETRLEAAAMISEESVRDKSLVALASDATRAGDIEVLQSALSRFSGSDEHDAAAQSSALALAKAGLRQEAFDIAKLIQDSDVRDKVLIEVAK